MVFKYFDCHQDKLTSCFLKKKVAVARPSRILIKGVFMKKLGKSLMIMLFLALSFANTGNAQFEYLENVEVSSCSSSGGCEVIVRQYTGFYTAYSVNVRCMDASGNFGSWHHWMYNGVYTGSACNGKI